MGTRLRARTFLHASIAAAVALPLVAPAAVGEAPATEEAPPMAHTRFLPTTTVLPDGDILVVAGRSNTDGPIPADTDTVERFDVDTGTWSFAAPLKKARSHHEAVRLHDGDVLVIGGWQRHANGPPSGATIDDAERFDVETGTWTWSRAGAPRFWHAATVLGDGRVLVSGGERVNSYRSTSPVLTAEFYDPATDRWSPAPTPPVHQLAAFAVTAPNGDGVFIGGRDTPEVLQRFVLATGRWEVHRTGWYVVPRLIPGTDQVVLPGGRVMRVGGWDTDWNPIPSTEILDLHTMTSALVAHPAIEREQAQMAVLPDGDVLRAGGWQDGTPDGVSNALERWDAETDTWSYVGSMRRPRARVFGVASEPGGSVLLLGGWTGQSWGRWTNTVERYVP